MPLYRILSEKYLYFSIDLLLVSANMAKKWPFDKENTASVCIFQTKSYGFQLPPCFLLLGCDITEWQGECALVIPVCDSDKIPTD